MTRDDWMTGMTGITYMTGMAEMNGMTRDVWNACDD